MNIKHLRMGQKTVRKLEFMTKKHEIAEKDGEIIFLNQQFG